MVSRLTEIKNRLEATKKSPHTYDPSRIDGVGAIQDIYWLVREIESLSATIRDREAEILRLRTEETHASVALDRLQTGRRTDMDPDAEDEDFASVHLRAAEGVPVV